MSDTVREESLWSPTVAAEPPRRRILGTMRDVLPNCGPIVAEEPGVHSLDQAERWYRDRAQAAYMSAARGKLAWLVALDVFVVAVLAVAGYPMWRVVALAATFTLSLAMFVFWQSQTLGRPATRRTPSHADTTLRMVPRFLLLLLGLALTGGVCSPLLPAALLPLSDLVIKNGWARAVRNVLALVAVALAVMALLPAQWFGPPLPQPAHWMVLLAVLVTAAVSHTRYPR